MKLHHLGTFVAVVNEGSFMAAGRTLRLAQSAISKQIAELERELRTSLLVRGPRGVRLTVAGEALAGEARGILDLRDQALAETRAAAGWHTGVLHLGHSDLMPLHEAATAAILAALSEQFPRMEIVSRLMTVAEQWHALEEHRIQIGLGYGGPPELGVIAHQGLADVFFREVLLSTAHPLAANAHVTFRDLADFTLLIFPGAVDPST